MSASATLAAPLPPCGRCQAALERDDLRCPVCGLATPSLQREPEPPGAAASSGVVRCDSCHAAVVYASEVQAPRCAYCGDQMRLEVPDDPLEQAQAAVAFALGPDEARRALTRFLSRRRWFRPSRLGEEATLDSLRAVFWPAWVFDADVLASWTADSDAGAARAAWAPHAGQTRLTFREIVVSASRGLTAAECAALAGAYDLRSAAEAPKGPPGAVIEPFEARRSGARHAIQQALEASAAQAVAQHEVPGTVRRRLRVAVLPTGLRTRRYSLPAYVLAYRYRGALYRVIVHGQDAECVVGKVPFSVPKLAAAVVAGLLSAGALGWAIVTFAAR